MRTPNPFYRDISLGAYVLLQIKTKSGNLHNSLTRSRTFNYLENPTTCRKGVLDVKRAFRLFSATSARNFCCRNVPRHLSRYSCSCCYCQTVTQTGMCRHDLVKLSNAVFNCRNPSSYSRVVVTYGQTGRNVEDSRSISETSRFGSWPLIETWRDVWSAYSAKSQHRSLSTSHTTFSEGKVKLETSVWITPFKGNTTPHPTQKSVLLTVLAQRS
jgi:hypothetical protein